MLTLVERFIQTLIFQLKNSKPPGNSTRRELNLGASLLGLGKGTAFFIPASQIMRILSTCC
jgi:hypothetical protein